MVVLRLSRPTGLVTAAVFEELFAEQLGAAFAIRHADSGAWCQALLGPPGVAWTLDDAARRLDATLDDADFLAPNYEAALLAPLFLALRNRAGLRTRLMLVAHAPGAWALEWALMGRLLAAGDLIVAPSANAADLIAFLDPGLARFITIIPHPMAPLDPVPGGAGAATERIVSLGRIHPSKLLHRQIEALDVLRRRGRRIPVLEIAGAAQTPEAAAYLLSLQAKVRRLGLEASVRFVGAIHGRAAKARFLNGATALLNLSVTIEESFGKAPIEALGSGIAVLSTRWDGLPETVGEGGVLIPVDCTRPGVPADVAAECVADGLEQLLDAPPPAEACRRHAGRFAPSVVLPRYRAALEAAHAARGASGGRFPEPPVDAGLAAPDRGLLAAAAPLTTMSWSQLFAAYAESCDDLRRSWEGDASVSRGAQLRGILLQGTRAPIESFLAGLAQTPPPPPPTSVAAGNFIEQVAAAAVRPGAPTTRVACLVHLWQAGRLDELRSGLRSLEGQPTPAVLVLRAEEAYLAGDLTDAFERACRGLDLHGDDGVTAFRLRQVARIARAAGVPERALPWLREWLERFPDSPDSGPVWLDLCVNAARAGGGHHPAEAGAALPHARALLGNSPVLDKVELLVASSEAAAALSG